MKMVFTDEQMGWTCGFIGLQLPYHSVTLSINHLINLLHVADISLSQLIVHDDFLNLLTKDPDDTPMSPPYSQSKPVTQSSSLQLQNTPSIPPHSLIAFGIFLRLPGYSEVLLKERKKAQYLLRLVLGVTDDGNGGRGSCFLWLSSSNISAIFFILHLLFIPFGSASSSDNISLLYSFFFLQVSYWTRRSQDLFPLFLFRCLSACSIRHHWQRTTACCCAGCVSTSECSIWYWPACRSLDIMLPGSIFLVYTKR